MDDLGTEAQRPRGEVVIEPWQVAGVELPEVALRRRRRTRGGLGAVLAGAVLVGVSALVVDHRGGLVAAGRSPVGPVVSDPGGGITLRYLPTGFDIVDDTAANGPTHSRTITYAPDPGRSSTIMITRSASSFDLDGELGEEPGARRIEINGRAGVLVAPRQGAILNWAPLGGTAVTLSVSSRDLPPEEVRRVASGIAYAPDEDQLPTTAPGKRGDGSDPIGPKVAVAHGGTEGSGWELVVYRSQAGLCADVVTAGRGSGGGCSPESLSGRALLGGQGGTRRPDGSVAQFVSGLVRKDVAQVRVTFDTGAPLLLSPVGRDAGFGVDFYVSDVPECRTVTAIIALAGDGRELDRLPFGPRPARPGQITAPTNCPSESGR